MKYCLRFYYSLRGFNQTDQALEVYLQDQASASLDRIWTQGERSRGIWVASDVTFQITQPAKVKQSLASRFTVVYTGVQTGLRREGKKIKDRI